MKRLCIAIGLVLLCAAPAFAQTISSNPFLDAKGWRDARGGAPDASWRVRYDVTTTQGQQAPKSYELTLVVGADWALAQSAERTTLYDYKLNRAFAISGDSFTPYNGLAGLIFRVMERQNRSYLSKIMSGAGAKDISDGCDADTELGVALPGQSDAVAAEVKQPGDALVLVCAGREPARFTVGDGPAPPPAFWPTAFAEFGTHPLLFERMRQSGHAPKEMDTSWRSAGPGRRTIKLKSVEQAKTPYPLTDAIHNGAAAQIDKLVGAGAGKAAEDAVSGRADGGAPTLASWGARLEATSQRDGKATAAMLLPPTLNMFPSLQTSCPAKGQHPACLLIADRAALNADPASTALFEIMASEQTNNTARVIAAMTRAQVSPLKDHPALGASYALALERFTPDQLKAAKAAGLPTDVAALRLKAVTALPYNPGYWTDIGDTFVRNWDYSSAYLIYEVAGALALPEPSPLATGRMKMVERIRADFPAGSLPK